MTVVNPKSISGINSITTGSGSDNLLTIHTSDANNTERVRVNSSGDVIVGSGITLSPDGDIFFTGIATGNGSGLTNLATDLVNDTSPQLGGDLDTNSHHILVDDDRQIRFGDSNDFNIQHNTNENYIQSNSGHIYIRANVDDDEGDNIYIQAKSGEDSIIAHDDGPVELYYDNSKKIETTSGGVTITGNCNVDGNITLSDSEEIQFGNSTDFRIFHDGTHSYIRDVGTGDLKVLSSRFVVDNAAGTQTQALFTEGGAVTLYYADSKKFETTTNGVTVTGELKAGTNTAATIPAIGAKVLVVGGGGAAGTTGGEGGGGGGGGFQEYANVFLVKGEVYTVVIGAGGGGTTDYAVKAGRGAPSSIKGSNIQCMPCAGGGPGATYPGQTPYGKAYGVGGDGASGGGGGGNYNADSGRPMHYGGKGIGGQGFDGGDGHWTGSVYGGGGGGGAGEKGENANTSTGAAGAGGDGLPSAITGSVTYYAGGGAGNSTGTDANGGQGGGANTGSSGTANTGGGGGAGNNCSGGSGIVIIRVLTADYSSTTSGSPTVTTSGSYTVIKFTGSGTYTA